LLYILFWRKKRFFVKPDMFNTRFKNWNMRALGCYPVERGKDLALIKHAREMLRQNNAIMLFPEGMRAFSSEDALALRNGAAMIAIMNNVPVVPMVLRRAPRLFAFNALKVGATISTQEYQGRKMEKSDLADLSGKIQTAMAGLLDNFEIKRKPKWWESQESTIARAIVIKDEKLLVIKRVKGTYQNDTKEKGLPNSSDAECHLIRPLDTYYVLPGGHVDAGETTREAATRETLEETGITCAPVRLLYKTKFRDDLESFYSCTYKTGTAGATDAPEYTDPDRNSGTYEPTLLPITELENIDLRPNCVRDQLILDIKKYGANLARTPKYVK